MISKLTILLFLFTSSSFAFLADRSDTGSLIKWPNSKSVNFFLTTSVPNLTPSEVSSITFNSVAQFSSHVPNSVSVLESNDGNVSGRSDIYTVYNADFFSDAGVIASTEIYRDPETGKIFEANIAINANYSFSNNPSSKNYLGNAMTHEIGHALGLDHSQLTSASMFYESRKGQYSIHEDDVSGIKYLYGTTSLGAITGKVAGSGNFTSVFGAHVSAYSIRTGKAVASSVSDVDGSFSISNLPIDDTYFIYVEPLNNFGSLSNYYNVAKKNYCDADNSYKGGFFQRCYGSDRGNPYGVSLTSSKTTVNMGNVSIRCGLEVSREYIISKGEAFTPELISQGSNELHVGSAHIGYFNAVKSMNTYVFDDIYDEYNIDLSAHDIKGAFPNKDLYLEVKVITQPFYSPLRVTTVLNHSDFSVPEYNPSTSTNLPTDLDGNYDLNVTLRIPISSDSLKNIYNLKVLPHNIDDVLKQIVNPPSIYDIFSLSKSEYEEDRHFYFMTTTLVERVGSQYIQVSQKNFGTYADNSDCMDGSQTYSVEANTVYEPQGLRVSSKKKDDSAFPLACGTITDINSGPPSNGPFASLFTLSFLLLFAMKVRSSQIV